MLFTPFTLRIVFWARRSELKPPDGLRPGKDYRERTQGPSPDFHLNA
jgi:hypothetical protein